MRSPRHGPGPYCARGCTNTKQKCSPCPQRARKLSHMFQEVETSISRQLVEYSELLTQPWVEARAEDTGRWGLDVVITGGEVSWLDQLPMA